MRANEFLNETELNELVTPQVGRSDKSITINIPASLFATQGPEAVAEEREEEQESVEQEAIEVQQEPEQEPADQGEESASQPDELDDIVRLSGGQRSQSTGPNDTIAAPAGKEVPANPVFISPLQQQLELQKQQGGKESPFINQIIDKNSLGSTAGEQPEQSVYHDNPLKDNEFVGASTGAIDKLRNATTTQGANKPWYKL